MSTQTHLAQAQKTQKSTPIHESSPIIESPSVEQPLRILMVSSELAPFAKAGGLGDAVASLGATLKQLGHDVWIVMPGYEVIDKEKFSVAHAHGPMCVHMGNIEEWCAVTTAKGQGDVPVFFIESKKYYGRQGLYHDNAMRDYGDNPARFGFLCRSALQLCIDRGFSPDIVHAHDWPAALACYYPKAWFWNNPVLGRSATVLTIHNSAYQGVYPRSFQPYLGINSADIRPEKFEDHGKINFLKGGLTFADMITTVSPTHAKEIAAPHGGFGLAPLLSSREQKFRGILNGADYDIWSPEIDPHIPIRFAVDDLEGKRECKRHLQQQFGLTVDEKVPLLIAIGRFVDQKGFSLISQSIENILNTMQVQFAILGTGDGRLENYFRALPSRYPGRAASYIGFDNVRAHLLEAGGDMVLMPSIYEPCGLTQMYSMRYGTLPIVRATGGLDDTVVNYDQTTGTGTGFKFNDATPQALYGTVGWAVGTYYDRPEHFSRLVASAMRARFSWEESAREYLDVYRKAQENKALYDRSFS